MSKTDKTYKGLKSYSSQGFILLGSTIALFIILSVFSIFLIKIVVKENQISSYNLMDIRARNLSQSGLDHGIQLFKAANSPYLGPVSKNFNNGQYTITFDPSNNETGNPLPYSHYAMTNSSEWGLTGNSPDIALSLVNYLKELEDSNLFLKLV